MKAFFDFYIYYGWLIRAFTVVLNVANVCRLSVVRGIEKAGLQNVARAGRHRVVEVVALDNLRHNNPRSFDNGYLTNDEAYKHLKTPDQTL